MQETLAAIAADALAKEAFVNAVEELSFHLGEENTVNLQNNMLTVCLNFSEGLKSVASKTVLQDRIEKCL